MIDIVRTQIIGYTMELNLKAKEFNILCEKLDKLKEKGIDKNDKRLLEIKELFLNNNRDILEIKKKIYEIQANEKITLNNIFEKKISEEYKCGDVKQELAIIEKENFFYRIIKKIKKWILNKN